MKTVIEIMDMLKALVSDRAFMDRHKEGEQSFSRKKKLDFQTVFFFVLSLVKLCLDFDSENFFNTLGIDVWPSAVTQRRAQINWTAFEEALEKMAEAMPQSRTLNRYRILAVDGMHGGLPRRPELVEKYGLVGNAMYPQFHAVAVFDVLNEFFLCASWDKYPRDEREAIINLIKTKKLPEKSVLLDDRGFPGMEVFKHLIDSTHKFVMRVSRSTFKEIAAFEASGKREDNVRIKYDKKRAKWNHHKSMSIELPCMCTLRCVRVDLPSGETEILVTNLSRTEFNADEIGKLYYLRWGIETSINHLKNAIHIETFVGVKDNSIQQEFFAGLIRYSLARLAVLEAQAEYERKKKRNLKLEYKINFTKAAAVLASKMAKIVKCIFHSLRAELEEVCSEVTARMVKYKTAIRRGRTYPQRKTSCRHPVQYRKVRAALYV